MKKILIFTTVLCLLTFLVVFFTKYRSSKNFEAVAQTSPTATDIIDQVGVLTPQNAQDIQAEIEELVTGFVNDSNDYNGLALQHNHTFTILLYYRARNTSTLAPLIPLLPGSISDTNTLKGKLAARLKNEVQNYLLKQGLWDFEQIYDQPSQGARPPWYTPHPNTEIGWYHRYNSGPYWEKFYAIWAYAHYTGDWSLIQSNLTFLIDKYNQGNHNRINQEYFYADDLVYRDDPVHLALGLIGMTRILDRFNNSLESQARSQAQTALGYLSDTTFTDRSVSQGQVRWGWDRTADTVQFEYPPCLDMKPELGRWYQTTSANVISNRINEAVNSTLLKDRYNAHMFNTSGRSWPIYDEAQWGLPFISFELFDCRAWVQQINPNQLRKEKPWPVIVGRVPKYRDMLYLQSLYSLLARSSNITWTVAEPN